jgi:hypothetical protein
MKRVIVAGIFLLANVAGPAMADACSTAGHGNNLPATGTPSITSLLAPGTGVYTCYNPGTRENNETLINGTQFQEYHNGGATSEIEGTYTITSPATGGLISYKYKSGGTFNYHICNTPSGSTYFFINTSNAVFPIVVSSGPGTC